LLGCIYYAYFIGTTVFDLLLARM